MSDGTGRGGAGDLLEYLDRAPLGLRYWSAVGLLAIVFIAEFFDLFIVGFLISVVGPAWGLDYGQSAIILLSAGVGSVVGAVGFGMIADRLGRKGAVIAGIAVCGSSSGLIAFLPEGAWQLFALLRFFVGVGIGGSAAPTVAMVVEYTPTRARTLVASALNIPAGAGVLLAAVSSAALLPLIGWRGVALLGFVPLLLALLCWATLPESIRWLIATGRHDRARRTAARQLGIPIDALPPIASAPSRTGPGSIAELVRPARRFWLIILSWVGISTAGYGVVLWGPTILSLLLSRTPAEAAALFGAVGVSALAGRAAFSVLPQFVGRRLSGQLMGFGAAAALACAALFAEGELLGQSAFLVMIVVAAFFYDGGCANLAPYAAEVYPVRLAARAAGLAAASNGIGRIIGPLCLALIAGAGEPLAPAATIAAVTPAFLTLAGCALVVGLVFTFWGIETHGRPLVTVEQPSPEGRPAMPETAAQLMKG